MTRIYTIGHSTRSADEFLALLEEQGIKRLVDVRRWPTSRRHPHFSQEPLSDRLDAAGIEYVHEPDLGGYRKLEGESPNTAWRSAGFRAYADHLASPEFREALDRVITCAEEVPSAVMCAEAVPWRCHRRLIADALVVRGHEVVHLLGPERSQRHELHPNARVGDDGWLIYPGDDQAELFDGAAGSAGDPVEDG